MLKTIEDQVLKRKWGQKKDCIKIDNYSVCLLMMKEYHFPTFMNPFSIKVLKSLISISYCCTFIYYNFFVSLCLAYLWISSIITQIASYKKGL